RVGIPIGTPTGTARRARSRVIGRRLTVVGATAMPGWTEVPRSPWTASQRKGGYWTGGGWSRRYWRLIAATTSGLGPVSAVSARAGPPGRSRSAMKTTTLAASTTSRAAPARRRRYQIKGRVFPPLPALPREGGGTEGRV